MTRTAAGILAISLLFGTASVASAKEGFYLGGGLLYNTIAGDFDGDTLFVSTGASEIIVVPDVDPGFGFALYGGYIGPIGLGGELGITHTGHDAEFVGVSLDTTLTAVNLDLRFDFQTNAPAIPYLLAGIGINVITVDDGAANTITGKLGEATYTGLGFHIGGGLDYYVAPVFSLGGRLTLRFDRYDEGEGIDSEGELPEGLKGDGISLLFGGTFHFGGLESGGS